ncbi:MAG: discoidin domain-containing protein, partial [Planctomycetota bacterium]|nr:discoidin domain-containing protein [Planctomycetota bacterium]
MRSMYAWSLVFLFCFSATSEVVGQAALDLPIRINLGGRAVTDSNGNAWLADQGVNVDSLDIRPNDIGGGQAIENWSAAVVPDSVTALGFDGNNAEDLQIFKDIRWDNAGEAPDWNMEITVPNGVYEVNFYSVDAGDGRHYQFALEGDIVADDVHQLAFPVGEGQVPGPNIAGKHSFIQIVNDGSLSIDILPGWGFPDPNPILQGLEILESDEDPCAEATAEQLCPRGFSVEVVNNVALLGTATTSSNCHGSVASRAIDGNIDGWWGNASTTHTCGEVDPWWEVDLHNTYDCDNISLWNRSDCCQERMAGITLQILDEAREVVFEVNDLDAQRERLISIDTEGTPGRFVRISRNTTTLSLSEVQIFSASPVAVGNWRAPLCADAPQAHSVYLNDELFLELDGDATGFVAAMPEIIGRDATFTLQAGDCESSITGAFGLFETPLRINFSGPDFVDADGNLWLGDQNGPGDALGIRPNDSNGANHILDWCGGGGLSNIRWDADSYHHPFELELPMANGLYSASLQFCEACCANRNFHVIVEGVNAGRVQQAGGERTTIVAETVVGDGSLSIVLIGIPGGDVNALITALEVVSLVPEICDNGIDDNDDGAVDCADAQCPPCPEICDNGTDDDRDGRVDCADDDCAEAASCIEICDNGVDDNGDGDVDGDDIQCSELEFAGELLVSLDARDGTAGSDLWRNRGSMGDFQRVGDPRVEERDHGIGVSFNENGRSGETYESSENAPAGIIGANPTRSIEMWVWPSTISPNEESLVSWGKRGGPDGSNMSFLWGNNAAHGAVGHWGGPDLGWNNAGGIPDAQQWHHLVYTYDG